MTTTPVERDVLAYSNCPVPNALLTALEAGLLAQEGIALEVLSGAQGALHFTYDHPAYTRFGGEIPPLVSEGLRAPGRTRLLGVTRFAGPQGFYVCADSPVRSPAELAGRRVGVSAAAIRILRRELGDYRQLDPWRQTLIALGTWEARGLLSTLERGGVKLGDVDLVAIETPGVDLPADRLSAATSVKGADLFPAVAHHQAGVLDAGTVDALFTGCRGLPNWKISTALVYWPTSAATNATYTPASGRSARSWSRPTPIWCSGSSTPRCALASGPVTTTTRW